MKPAKRREKRQARRVEIGPLPFPNMLPLPEDNKRKKRDNGKK